MRPGGVLLASALAESLALDAGAQDDRRRWIALSSPEASTAVYGTPESEDLVISFSCKLATRQIVVGFIHEPVGAKDGMRIGMELSSEGGRVRLDATAERLPPFDDRFLLLAETTLSPALRPILTDGKTLSVKVQDRGEEIPLRGAADAAADLIKACE
jgi:hypothetical protein